MQVIEHAQPLRRGEIDAHLLVCFTDRRREEIGVAGFTAPARKGDLSRPGVARPHGAMDKEDFEACGAVM